MTQRGRHLAPRPKGREARLFGRAVPLALAFTLFAASVAMGAVSTDQADYVPGSVVMISGDGMTPGESVMVDVYLPDDSLAQSNEVVADETGNFTDTYQLSQDGPLGTYTAVATGQSSGATFSTTFTDTDPASEFTAFSITPTPVAAGGTLSWSASAVCKNPNSAATQCEAEGTTHNGPVVDTYNITVQQVLKGATCDFSTAVTDRDTEQTTGGTGTASGSFTAPATPGTYCYRPRHQSQSIDGTQWATAVGNDFVEEVVVQAANTSPTADANGPYFGDEGSPVELDGTGSFDLDGTIDSYSWEATPQSGGLNDPDAGASCSFDDVSASMPQVTCTDDGIFVITLTVTDDDEATDDDTTTLTLDNVDPTIDSVTLDPAGGVYPVGTEVTLVAGFSDQGTNDSHTCGIIWDDPTGSTTEQAGAIIETDGSGTCTLPHTFNSAGVYSVQVTVRDDDGGEDTESLLVVIYDPSAGFVTGGGWINSPVGAYVDEPDLTGKANFGFVSKYKKGASVPDGQTEFQFHAGNFRFHSSSYQWLVISGCKAQYKGTGAVNGVSGYGFLLTAYDGQINGCSSDGFRIKITDSDGIVVYDNRLGESDDIDTANPLGISGGSIVIHKGK